MRRRRVGRRGDRGLGIWVLVACSLLAAACGGGASPTSPASGGSGSGGGSGTGGTTTVRWSFNGSAWQATGSPPACPTPLTLQTPVNLDLVTSVLYPGQVRANEFKAHGGFRFDRPGQTADLEIRAPMGGMLLRGAKYLVLGEIQYTIDWIHECGIMLRFGHLRDLAPRINTLATALPQNPEGDSRATGFPDGHVVATGELIGTATGLRTTGNIFLDWGVYDLRQRNAASSNAAWLAQHNNDTHPYGICWFDNLPPADAARVKALPSSDSAAGTTSDYCR